jgi:hypothetical protein
MTGRKPPPLQTKYDFGRMSVGDRLVVQVLLHEEDPWEVKRRVGSAFRQWRRRTRHGWWRMKIAYDPRDPSVVIVSRLPDEGSEAARSVVLLKGLTA